MAELSVVLISRNQAWNIARLIASCLDHTASLADREIILVDSASSDQTVELARQYPITVLRLHADQPLSAAAGRYVGYRHSSGRLVLFLDGDMELCAGWLDEALAVLESHPDAGAVTGRVVDCSLDDKPDVSAGPSAGALREVRHGGGAALYRRAVLEQVGPFNPYLISDEEPELCLRIRHAGYRVLQTESLIAYHFSPSRTAIATLLARRRRRLYVGYGQTMRYHLGTPLLWAYVRERGFAFAPGVWIALGLASLAWSLISGGWGWLAAWLALTVCVFAADALRKRSLYRAAFSLVHRLLMLEGTLRGLWLPRPPAHDYPGRVDVIRRADQEGQVPQ